MKDLTPVERVAVSELLREIKEKSLENTLRSIFLGGLSVQEALKTHRPETS